MRRSWSLRSSQRRYLSTRALIRRVAALEVEERLQQVDVDRRRTSGRGSARRPRVDGGVEGRLVEPPSRSWSSHVAGDVAKRLGESGREPHQPGRRATGSKYGRSSDSTTLFSTYRPYCAVERRHLHIAAVTALARMDPAAEGAHQVASCRCPIRPAARASGRRPAGGLEDPVDDAVEPPPDVGVDRLDVERVGLPDVGAVGERVERLRMLRRAEGLTRGSSGWTGSWRGRLVEEG